MQRPAPDVRWSAMEVIVALIALGGLVWAIISWAIERRDRKVAEAEVQTLRGHFERWAVTNQRAFRVSPRPPTAKPGGSDVQELRIEYEPAFPIDALDVTFRFERQSHGGLFDSLLPIRGEVYDFDRLRPHGVATIKWTAERYSNLREGVGVFADFTLDGDPDSTRHTTRAGNVNIGTYPV